MQVGFITLFAFISFGISAQAACVKKRGNVCGDDRICVSDERKDGISDPNACLEKKAPGVCKALRLLADKYGDKNKLEVVSADRSRNCARRGGAGCSSAHARCMAVDMRIPGVEGLPDESRKKRPELRKKSLASQKEILPTLKGLRTKLNTRYNIYSSGIVHLDIWPVVLPNSYKSAVEGPNVPPGAKPPNFHRKRRYK